MITHALRQAMGDDDLGRAIDGDSAALDIAVLGQQHPALWIGEAAAAPAFCRSFCDPLRSASALPRPGAHHAETGAAGRSQIASPWSS